MTVVYSGGIGRHVTEILLLEMGNMSPDLPIGAPVDLVWANLHYQVSKGLIHQTPFFEKRWIILSGLPTKDAKEIERQLNGRGIMTLQKFQEKNWLTWAGINLKFNSQK